MTQAARRRRLKNSKPGHVWSVAGGVGGRDRKSRVQGGEGCVGEEEGKGRGTAIAWTRIRLYGSRLRLGRTIDC